MRSCVGQTTKNRSPLGRPGAPGSAPRAPRRVSGACAPASPGGRAARPIRGLSTKGKSHYKEFWGEQYFATLRSSTSPTANFPFRLSPGIGERACNMLRILISMLKHESAISLQALLSFIGDLPQGGRAHTRVWLPPTLWPEQDAPARAGDPAKRGVRKKKTVYA